VLGTTASKCTKEYSLRPTCGRPRWRGPGQLQGSRVLVSSTASWRHVATAQQECFDTSMDVGNVHAVTLPCSVFHQYNDSFAGTCSKSHAWTKRKAGPQQALVAPHREDGGVIGVLADLLLAHTEVAGHRAVRAAGCRGVARVLQHPAPNFATEAATALMQNSCWHAGAAAPHAVQCAARLHAAAAMRKSTSTARPPQRLQHMQAKPLRKVGPEAPKHGLSAPQVSCMQVQTLGVPTSNAPRGQRSRRRHRRASAAGRWASRPRRSGRPEAHPAIVQQKVCKSRDVNQGT
jgi:hypothetical protein